MRRRALSIAVRRRKSHLLLLFLGLCSVVALGSFWDGPVSTPLPDIPIPYHRRLSTSALPFANTFNTQPSSWTLLPSPTQALNGNRTTRSERQPSFHILIPATEANDKLCKTLLSAFILNYPSPTLINFGVVFTGEGWDKGSHAGKIKGVYEYLSKNKKVNDNDLVLVIDGYDIWLQLPPEVMVKRYLRLIEEANKRLASQYGTVTEERPWEGNQKEKVQRYVQTVIFGADKICWPNQPDDPACASLPDSTLPAKAYGPNTDKDPEAFTNRPKYLNSGTIIGPVDDVRAIYERALEKMEQIGGAIGDQFIFAEILGEQEYTRQMSNSNQPTPWYQPLFSYPGSRNSMKPVKNITLDPNRRYDFSIGLDYSSALFQTVTHSANDIVFTTHTNLTSSRGSSALPLDVTTARPPFPTNNTPTEAASNRYIPISPTLDTFITPINNTWSSIPLAKNIYADSIPTLIHINGDKSFLESWWPSLWYHSNARALLRAYVRTPQPFLWDTVGGAEKSWDKRGGRGGVWTSEGWWMEWGDVCKGVEDGVFGDGKGEWGMEDGDGRTWNVWGSQVTGKVVEDVS